MMRAIRFHRTGGPEVLQMEELPTPAVVPGALLVKVASAGINFADTVRRRGLHYPVPTPLPFIPGGEVFGTVVEVGAGVTGFVPGDRVFGNPGAGGCADYVVVPATKAFAAPATIDPVIGVALVIQGLTAALMLRNAGRLQAGECVFVEGAAGGVGLLAIQLARADGAGLVIGGASSAERRALAEKHGAHRTVDYAAPGWRDALMAASDGRAVDLVLEMSGGDIFSGSLDCLAPFGRMVIYGNASGTPVPTPPQRLIGKNQSLIGFYLGGYMADRPLIERTLADLAARVADARLSVHLGGVYDFEGVQEAHRLLESRAATGKLILRLN